MTQYYRKTNLIITKISSFRFSFRTMTMQIPSKMKAWQIHNYGKYDGLLCEEVNVPALISPNQILVETYATSVNPIDLLRLNGYGANLFTMLGKKEGMVSDLPLIPCHDVSGKIVAMGQKVEKFSLGDEIWGTVSIFLPGALSKYTLVKESEISLKPKVLSHIEAASIPYVACTTWAALSKYAKLDITNYQGKRVLILGGSGGVGTFAIQLLKALKANVTATCSTSNIDKLKELNCDFVVDYTQANFVDELRNNGKYDVVMDTVGNEDQANEAKKMLNGNLCSMYTSLVTPFTANITKNGLAAGILLNAVQYGGSILKNLVANQIRTNWTMFAPNAIAMETTRQLVENKMIVPVVEKVFCFDNAKSAFEKVAGKHNKGKTIIQIKSD